MISSVTEYEEEDIHLDLGWIFSKDVVNRLYPHHDVLSPQRAQLI